MVKTREFFIVEAFVHFQVDTELRCDETYVFPDQQLLLSAKADQMRSIKDIFKKESKSEMLKLEFSPHKLTLSGSIQKDATYEIESTRLNRYGTYLDSRADVASNYKVTIPLKHILSVLRVAETLEADINCAMEVQDADVATCFFFTKNRDFCFTLGVGSITFENLDDKLLAADQIAGVITKPVGGARLKKAIDDQMQEPKAESVKKELPPSVIKQSESVRQARAEN